MVHHAGIMAAARREGRRQCSHMAEAATRPRPLPFTARAAPPSAAPRRYHVGGGAHGRGRGRYTVRRARGASFSGSAPHPRPQQKLPASCWVEATAPEAAAPTARRGVARCAAKRRRLPVRRCAEAVLPGERDVGALVPFFWSCGLGATVVPHSCWGRPCHTVNCTRGCGTRGCDAGTRPPPRPLPRPFFAESVMTLRLD